MREKYLKLLVSHLSNSKDIQTCLCDNPDQDTLISMEPIKDNNMKDLYLLPSGRCVQLDDLIAHLKTSENKMLDPTYSKFEHGPDPSNLWENGWQLREMLDRIQTLVTGYIVAYLWLP